MHGFSDDCNSRFRIPEMGLVLTISHLMSLQKSLTSPFLDISLSSSLTSFRSRVGISHASNGKPPEIDWLTGWINIAMDCLWYALLCGNQSHPNNNNAAEQTCIYYLSDNEKLHGWRATRKDFPSSRSVTGLGLLFLLLYQRRTYCMVAAYVFEVAEMTTWTAQVPHVFFRHRTHYRFYFLSPLQFTHRLKAR